jgi:superfamily II DNA or RNA helicase
VRGKAFVKGIRLRDWQKEALAILESRLRVDPSEATARVDPPDARPRAESKDARHHNFLAVATPGAGKTTFALAAMRTALVERRVKRLFVVVPTQHLKRQWAEAAERFDIHLDPEWSAGDGALPSDVHGIATTYQQVAANPAALRRLAKNAFVVLDEIHHAADARSWGDGVRQAFDPSWLRLCMSGTPFRSDQSAIPFVRYVNDEAVPDYEYGYGHALDDETVVRPVYFPRINGRMEWTAPSGDTYEASFEDPLSRTLASQRLRTALDLEGMWLPAVLTKAHRQLEHLRARDPMAAGIVIAMDQQHARGIARILKDKLGVRATVATSDDARASNKIADFTRGDAPWIVAVRMVSEGVDIPRLRVGVYATNTVTDLFFRQAVGRLVRVSRPGLRQLAYMFIPDDSRLRLFASGIAEQRRHSLRKPEPDGDAPFREPDPMADPLEREMREMEEEQLSLFSAISAIPLDEHGRLLEPSPIHEESLLAASEVDEGGEEIPDFFGEDDAVARPVLVLTSPEPAFEVPTPLPEAGADPEAEPDTKKRSSRSRRLELRELNSARVRRLVHRTGKGHADINAELNRKVGIRRVTEATVAELEKRLDAADRWLEKITAL